MPPSAARPHTQSLRRAPGTTARCSQGLTARSASGSGRDSSLTVSSRRFASLLPSAFQKTAPVGDRNTRSLNAFGIDPAQGAEEGSSPRRSPQDRGLTPLPASPRLPGRAWRLRQRLRRGPRAALWHGRTPEPPRTHLAGPRRARPAHGHGCRRGGGTAATRQSAARPADGRWEGAGLSLSPPPPGARRRAPAAGSAGRRGLVEDGS